MIALLIGGSAWAAAPDAEPGSPESEAVALRREVAALREELQALRSDAAEHLDHRSDRGRTSVGGAVIVAEGEEVDEAVAVGGDVRVSGTVTGDAVSFGGDVVVEPTGRVAGDAVSWGGRVVVAEGGRIGGDRVTTGIPGLGTAPSHEDRDRPVPAVHVDGSVSYATEGWFSTAKRKLVWMLSLGGAGVLVVGLFPARVGRVARDLEDRPLRAAVVGTLGGGFLALFAVLFTLLTLGLGLPVGAFLVAVLGFAWILGFVALCQAVGDRLPFEARPGSAWPSGRWVAFLVGVLLLTFAGSLPWVGWLVIAAASVLGVGATFATRFGGS